MQRFVILEDGAVLKVNQLVHQLRPWVKLLLTGQ